MSINKSIIQGRLTRDVDTAQIEMGIQIHRPVKDFETVAETGFVDEKIVSVAGEFDLFAVVGDFNSAALDKEYLPSSGVKTHPLSRTIGADL